jgi:hypothetical protein
MIRPGRHRITQQPRTVAECDAPGCDESVYLHDVTVHTGGNIMRTLGWEVSDAATVPGEGLPAWCSVHAQRSDRCSHDTTTVLDRVAHCQHCGRRRDEIEGKAA